MENQISQKQMEANQRNALLGGGKTEQGKEISKFNAQKHGILRQTITDYERDFYFELLDQLGQELKPEGIIEEMLVDRIATYYLRLFRAAKAEGKYVKSVLNPHITVMRAVLDDGLFEPREVVEKEGYKPQITPNVIGSLDDIYLRYEITLENRIYRTLQELERIKRRKTGERIFSAPVDLNARVSNMGSFSENT